MRSRPLSACGDDGGSGGAPRVVATTTQAADLARQVAGDRAEVTSILKPNSDPHAYEPRAGDVKALARADLVVRSGGEIDEWLEEAQAGAGSDAPVLTLGTNTREEPHWWQDPRAALRAVTVLRDGLTQADAAGKADYAANAERYAGELRRLDRDDRALRRHDPGREAQARHHPRRARRLRATATGSR